jgi:hypothetical protein
LSTWFTGKGESKKDDDDPEIVVAGHKRQHAAALVASKKGAVTDTKMKLGAILIVLAAA